MFGFFYNSSIKRYITLMQALMSHIQVRRVNEGGESRLIRVPIQYANKEAYAAALDKINMPTSEHNIAKVETILPRMSLSLIDLQYNGTFKTNITNRRIQTLNDGKLLQQFNPVPYKFIFELGIYTRNEDDMFQIVEQIVPYFQPHFTCKITELYDKQIIIKDRDVNIVIQGITPDESADGPAGMRRRLEWTIMFELNGWLYPNTQHLSSQIRTIYIDFFANIKELPDHFESVDTQVVPKDVDKEDWDGSYKQTYTTNVPKEQPPRPQ